MVAHGNCSESMNEAHDMTQGWHEIYTFYSQLDLEEAFRNIYIRQNKRKGHNCFFAVKIVSHFRIT